MMTSARALWRVAASCVLVAGVAALAVAAPGAFVAGTDVDAVPVEASGFDTPDLGIDDETADAGATPTPTDSGDEAGAADDAADSGTTVETGSISFQPRTPESQASVYAYIAAYRLGRNLPTADVAPNGFDNCVWGPGGSVFPWDISPTESLGAALVRRMPAAVNFQGPTGSVTVVMVNADEFIDSTTGTVYPGQVGVIAVKYCSPPPPPPPPPPSDPPADPSTPPSDPTDPPAT
jgi:hypothetical protein